MNREIEKGGGGRGEKQRKRRKRQTVRLRKSADKYSRRTESR